MNTQFNAIKAKYPDALLMFRVGDNYKLQKQDAEIASKILKLPLTGTPQDPEIEFPFHSMDTYLAKLVKAGHRVAVCDELSAAIPKPVKKPKAKPVQLVIGQAIQQPLFT